MKHRHNLKIKEGMRYDMAIETNQKDKWMELLNCKMDHIQKQGNIRCVNVCRVIWKSWMLG